MQWQHGKYQILANGSLITQPFEVDGRQLLSQPCEYDHAIYTRYNQSELFEVRLSSSPPSRFAMDMKTDMTLAL
jgi:hypothetical protein